jgi:sec-independent protein translocase protein TatC
MRFMPRVEDTFDQYMKMLLAMVIVFQMPTVVFFLARMRMVTARFLMRNIKYAVLAIFVAAAVLTSSPDAWNQIVFAAPMLALYGLSIAIAWIVEPSHEPAASSARDSAGLRLVFAATVIDQARRQTARTGEGRLRALSH